MIKSLLAANKSEKDRFVIPRSVQQSIPIRCVYSDGIWHTGRKHSRTWRFADINYAAASEEERRSIFLSYCAVLNSLPILLPLVLNTSVSLSDWDWCHSLNQHFVLWKTDVEYYWRIERKKNPQL